MAYRIRLTLKYFPFLCLKLFNFLINAIVIQFKAHFYFQEDKEELEEEKGREVRDGEGNKKNKQAMSCTCASSPR